MNHPICLGDPTTGGGAVIDCQLTGIYEINGISPAVVGDKATCPLHLGIYAFVEGDPDREMQGKAVVLQGHRLTCGCHALAVHAAAVDVG
jgi:uncharacterized Zn-binding protein involved in type VI secretion